MSMPCIELMQSFSLSTFIHPIEMVEAKTFMLPAIKSADLQLPIRIPSPYWLNKLKTNCSSNSQKIITVNTESIRPIEYEVKTYTL